MNRKNLPLLLMLAAGAVTSIITYVKDYTLAGKLVALFVVLLVFYVLGTILKWALDYFDEQNQKRLEEEAAQAEETESTEESETEEEQESD